MSYTQHNPDDYLNNRTLYAYTPKTFYRHGTIWGKWQDYDTITTFSQFSEHVQLSPIAETMHITTEVVFPQWHATIEGHDYYAVIIYTSDKLLSPEGNSINAFIVDPLETEFVETNPMRPFDYFYPEIIKNLNDHYQLYLNLEKAAKYIEDTINLITPIKGNNLSIHDRQTNIAANVATIYTKIPVSTLQKFFSAVDYFFITYQELAHKSGTANIIKEIPAHTDYLPLLNYYNYIDSAFTPGFSAGGTRQETFNGVITSFYYQNPEVAFRQWFQLVGYTYPSYQLLRSREVLSELGLTAPVQKTNWITSIEGARGKWNIYGINNNWDNPLSLQEMEEGFGQNKLEKLTVEERTGTSATVSLEFLTDWFDEFYEVGLVYSTTSSRPGFQSYSNSIPASQFEGLIPNEGVSFVSKTDIFTDIKTYKGLKILYNLKNLTANTTYHVRPFILLKTYSHGQFDGYFLTYLDDFTFSTDLAIPLTPYIKPGLNAEVTDITQLTAKVTVNVGSTYEGAIPERGVLISSTNLIPEFKNGNINTPGEVNRGYKTSSQSEDEYVVLLSQLSWKTKYYVRPYMVQYLTPESEPVIIYGDAITFGTPPFISIPFISLSGNKTADGEGIDIKVDATVQYDYYEDTLFYYYIQAITEDIPNEIPAQAKLIGKKDHTVSSYLVNLSAQVSITGLVKGLYRLLVMGKNSSGIGHNSLRFGVGIDSSTVSVETINTPVTTQSAPTAMISAEIVSNAYVKMSAYITKLGSTYEWAKLKVLSADKTTTFFEKDLEITFDELTGLLRYGLWNIQVSALAANTSFVAQLSVKTSYISVPALFEQTFTTPATWDTAYRFKFINPVVSKSVVTDSSYIRVAVNVDFPEQIEAGGKMILCIYDLLSMNGQSPTLSNYTEKKEITATKEQSIFIYYWNFTKPLQYMLKAYYVDTDTRVYDSVHLSHTVELADVVAFTKYYIFYNLNGAEGTISPTEGSPNSNVPITSIIPTRDGYTFAGWNTNTYGTGTSFTPGATYLLSDTITMYAKWIPNKVVVKFNPLNGSTIQQQTVDIGDKCIRPANPIKAGYIFSHWFESAGNQNLAFDFNTVINTNKELYAYWISELISNSVIFNSNGGDTVPTQTVLYNKKVTVPKNPAKAGYSFAGWYTDEACTHLYDFDTMVTTYFILHAKWVKSMFTVTFNSNGGTPVDNQMVGLNWFIERPIPPVKSGEYFVGWSTTNTDEYNIFTVLYDFNTPVTSNITLYACYSNSTVRIEYNVLKYTDSNEKTSSSPYIIDDLTEGFRLVAKDSYEIPPTIPILNGYIFDGWYYVVGQEDATSVVAPQTLNWGINMLPFNFSQKITKDYGVSLFTKWKKGSVYYNVSFDALNNTAVKTQKVIAGGKIIPPTVPTKTGYSFSHWYITKQDIPFDFNTLITTDIVLKAFWVAKNVGTYQVTFETYGGTSILPKSVAEGAVCESIQTPVKQGYRFKGWYTTPDFSQVFNPYSKIVEDTILYAKWEDRSIKKTIFSPPTDAAHGDKYYFYDRIWTFDATDSRWRLDYPAMINQHIATASREAPKAKASSRSVLDSNIELENVKIQLETLNAKVEENAQMAFNVIRSNQDLVNTIDNSFDAHIINLKRGQYLTDALDYINQVGDATAENPYTINFYNHSKTINWDNFTEKIPWPRHVYLNFVGDISWWGDGYYLGKGFDQGLISDNPNDKLFLGFSFDRSNEDGKIFVSGLPLNLNKIFFGGLDISWQEAASYQNLIDNPGDWGEFEFNLVRVNGSKDNDSRNDKLYKKINGLFVDITPDFRECDFTGVQFIGAYLYSANLWSANLGNANLMSANLRYANLENANLKYANLGFANLENANLGNANLISANLENSNLRFANLENANLWNANIENANLMSANLKNDNLGNVNLGNANLMNVNLEYANLWNANLMSAKLENANLGNANLEYANLWNAHLMSANLRYANLVEVNLKYANLGFADLEYANLWNVNLMSANLENTNLGNANLGNANLEYANLGNANLVNIQVNTSSNFQGANLTGAYNLPENLNTKAGFIAAVGAGNVNATTLWIDGTSILS